MKFELTASGRPGSCSKSFTWALRGLAVATGAVICGGLVVPSAVAQVASHLKGDNAFETSAGWHPHHHHYRDKHRVCSDGTLMGRYNWSYTGWNVDKKGVSRPYV